VLLRQRDGDMVAKEVTQMRERWRAALDRSNAETFDLKQGIGGLVDIEFVAQQTLLAHGSENPTEPAPPADTAALLAWLASRGLMPVAQATELAAAHRRLLDRGLRCALALEKRLVPVTEGQALAASM
jgi:glutamate-ammonia-ligase adenylyltransferase